MVAIIYTRVSTDDQVKHGFSLEIQKKMCMEKAKKIGCTEYIHIADEGISGDIISRPGILEVRKLIQKGGVDYFIAYDLDRFSRSLMAQLVIADEIEKNGVKIDFVNGEWKNTPEGKLFVQIRGAIAEFEKAKIRERTNVAKIAKAKAGKLTHFPGTFGYTYCDREKVMEIHDEEAKIVRMMFSWLLEPRYIGPHEIAARLNDMGVPAPRGEVWYRQTVRRILKNSAYSGTMFLRVYNTEGRKNNKYRAPEERVSVKIRPKEEWCPVSIPQIIPTQQWDEAQRRMEDARRKRPGHAKSQYLLSGLCVCGECGHTMHGNRGRNRHGKKYEYYVCTAKSPGIRGQEKCSSVHVPKMKIERAVWDRVSEWLLDPELLAADIQKQGEGEEYTQLTSEKTLVSEQIQKVQEERVRLLKLYQKGILPEGLADSSLTEVNHREKRLVARLGEIDAELETHMVAEKEIASLEVLQKEYAEKIGTLDFESRRCLVNLLVSKVVVRDDMITIKIKIPRLESVVAADTGFGGGGEVLEGGNDALGSCAIYDGNLYVCYHYGVQ